MQYTMQIAAFAILAGLTQLTLGEYSAEQLGIQISTVTTAITNADDYVVNNVKTATGDLFVQQILTNSNNIAGQLGNINENLDGTKLTNDNSAPIDEALTNIIDAFASYLSDLADKAGDFLHPNDKTGIKTATDSLDDTFDDFIDAIDELLPAGYEAAIEQEDQEVQEDAENFDIAYRQMAARRRSVRRV